MKTGASRFVFLTKHYAIKIPRLSSWRAFCQGCIDNMTEQDWHSFLGFKCRFAPIKFSFPMGLCNFMVRCEPITKKEFRNIRIKDYGSLPERKISSFGWYKKDIVAVDYHDKRQFLICKDDDVDNWEINRD